MEKEFVKYEQALALKELGFDEPCLLSLSWINGYNTYTEKSNEPKAWISSNVEIKYDFSQFKVDFKNVYHVETQIPLYQQSFRFFREKQYYSEINVGCTQIDGTIGFSWRIWKPWSIEEWSPERPGEEWSYETYEEAENACLDKLIEITKNK